MEADPEHQQDDADLRKLTRQPLVRDEAGGEGAHGDTSQQVTDQRRQLQFARDEASDEGEDQAQNEVGDQAGLRGHRRIFRCPGGWCPFPRTCL